MRSALVFALGFIGCVCISFALDRFLTPGESCLLSVGVFALATAGAIAGRGDKSE